MCGKIYAMNIQSKEVNSLTGNQINYWRLQEDKRHNVTTETETNRHNVRTEDETERHNRTTEGIDISKLNETKRHNLATEGIEGGKLSESIRHNKATEGIQWYGAQEQSRHNMAGEQIDIGRLSEDTRHNIAGEDISKLNLGYNYSYLGEQNRHNQATESIDRYQAVSQDQLRQAQAALSEAEREYKNMSTTWDGLLKSANVNLTAQQKQYYQDQSRKIQAEIDNINHAIALDNVEEARRYLETLNSYLNTGARYVDALVPG